jgi:hypothetical protein
VWLLPVALRHLLLQVDKYDKADGDSPRVQRKQVSAGLCHDGELDAASQHAEFYYDLLLPAGKADSRTRRVPFCICSTCQRRYGSVSAYLSAYLS